MGKATVTHQPYICVTSKSLTKLSNKWSCVHAGDNLYYYYFLVLPHPLISSSYILLSQLCQVRSCWLPTFGKGKHRLPNVKSKEQNVYPRTAFASLSACCKTEKLDGLCGVSMDKWPETDLFIFLCKLAAMSFHEEEWKSSTASRLGVFSANAPSAHYSTCHPAN